MQLILLLIIFGIFGYLIAGTDFSERVDRATDRASVASDNWVTRFRAWWRALISNGVTHEEFLAWVTGPGADSLPDDFQEWYRGLTKVEGQAFVDALSDYADGLGYNLMQLVAGGLEQKPIMKQVFVEAIVVYSDAYRKAEDTHQNSEEETQVDNANVESEMKPAQKSASRRKRPKAAESAEVASAA